jgi:putative DNA primase/helicase
MRAVDIARVLGGARPRGGWWSCRCPAHDDHSPSLSLRDGARGLIVKCWAGCDTRDVLAALRRLGLTAGRANGTRLGNPGIQPLNNLNDTARRTALAKEAWTAGRDPHGTPVVQYLIGRGIEIEPPSVLRWFPRCWHGKLRTELPAMLARVDGPDGVLVAVHRTYLQRDDSGQWQRFDRAALGPIGGGAVRLGVLRPDLPLTIAEGVESALAASELKGWPAWAALSAGGIERLILPPEARDIFVAIDRDRNGTGKRAARRAAQRWVRQGRRVRLLIPDRIGADPNDLLRQAGYAA